MTSKWPKRIRVDKDIVTLLSRRTYDNFPQALREVVGNAYDADATLVDIRIDTHKDVITITDNGWGMTPDDFDHYLRIATFSKEGRAKSRLGRRRIGHFGIGFLSIFPFCNSIEITSTTENSDTVLLARIDSKAYITPSASGIDVGEILVNGAELQEPTFRRRHGTTIKLIGLNDLVTQYFQSRPDAKKTSVQSWSWQERLSWELQQILPIQYHPDSPFGSMLYGEPGTPMEVRLNGDTLYRNALEGAEVLESSAAPMKLPNHDVHFTYAIVTPRKTIKPLEGRGLQLRLRNVAIGPPTYFGLNVTGKLYAKLTWLAGEVHILDGLDDELSLDRNMFTWSPRYEELSEFFLARLRSFAERMQKEHEATRDIEDFVGGDMHRAPAIPRKDAIEARIDQLVQAGYEVERAYQPHADSVSPVQVDTERRSVTYYVDHPQLRDVLEIAGKAYEVEFDRWDYWGSPSPACRVKSNKITFNQDYPLFRYPRIKEVAQRLAALLEIGRTSCASVDDLCEFVLEQLAEERDSI